MRWFVGNRGCAGRGSASVHRPSWPTGRGERNRDFCGIARGAARRRDDRKGRSASLAGDGARRRRRVAGRASAPGFARRLRDPASCWADKSCVELPKLAAARPRSRNARASGVRDSGGSSTMVGTNGSGADAARCSPALDTPRFDRRDPRLHQLMVVAYRPAGDKRVSDRLGMFIMSFRNGYGGRWRLLEATVSP